MAPPITPALKSSARSAYRALFRASGATFSGDDRVLYAFRDKVRTETVAGRQEVDPVEYEARVKHAFEVADVLKKNVVQAVKEGEGEDTAWRLRMTSDTELGSNEGVKAPYSRPTRGTPRPKCGEDPNAVSPLPPRSLRHMTGSNSTRAYSTAASSSPSNPTEQQGPESRVVYEYDPARVESVRNRLHEVNRRVSASPTGREFMTERPLVEDKLSALAARMEFFASEMHDKLYPPSSNSAPAQTLVDLLLDHLPISPQSTVDLVGPPAQLRQYIRFLQNAAKYTNTARTQAVSLSPGIRKAIAELVETPAPRTRSPNNVLKQLRAIQWRLLMIKRGVQGIVRSHTVAYSEVSTTADALRGAMRNIGYAQECVEDLETKGPRIEDARTLLEEMEKFARGSFIMDLRKEMESRLGAGVAGKRVEEAIISHGLSPAVAQTTRKVYRRMNEYEEYPRATEFVTTLQERGGMKHVKKWRRKLFSRSQKVLNNVRMNTAAFNTALDQLIAMHPENDPKVALLREAKQALELDTDITQEYMTHVFGKAKYSSWFEWACVISRRLDLVGELVHRAAIADIHLEQYAWGESVIWGVDTDKRDLFFETRMELVIINDVVWRLERRMKQDVEDLQEVSLLLCEEVQSEIDIPRYRNFVQAQVLLSAQASKQTTSSSVGNSATGASVRTRRQPNAKRRSRAPLSKDSSNPSPKLVEPVLQTLAPKIAYFQEKLVEIRGNMHNQIATIDIVARILDVEEDRLHPLVHCKHILELNTSSALQELLQAIADKSPKGQKHTTQEDTTAIWLESRILAVQLWVVKKLLLGIQMFDIENKELHARAQSLFREIEAQINEMNLTVVTLRDMFHRVRPGRIGQSQQEDWTKRFFVKEDVDSGLDDLILPPTASSSQPAVPHTGALASHSILLENLAVVAAYSRRESAIWKIERFLSRIEEVYSRVSRVIGRLDELAEGLRVAGDRTHPVVSCKHVLQLNTFSSLDMVLRILRKRTPKNRIELEQGMGEALWLDSRLPEVQLEVVKMRLWAFHQTTKSQGLPRQQKNLIRSIRGRIKVAHSLLRNSREEFGSYGPQGKFEIAEDTLTERRDHEGM
ncbi:hypothetical protein FRC11_006257 [Ceratobasidium sp. 423]|nr:hypothetical protein FRC11_006257 [Ceratobasidium sp. 423]